jgi:hypothetical protein
MIAVYGLDKERKAMVKSLCDYTIQLLMPRMKNKLNIKFKFIDDLVSSDGVYGDCEWLEETCRRPRNFAIRIDSSQENQLMLETVAHELVHVKQYARGEMKELVRSSKYTRWKGKDINHRELNYYDQPWEIEAHGRETGIFIRWLSESRWKKCKWCKY